MSSFKKLNTKIYQKVENITEDTIYWKKLGTPVLVKEFGPIDYVNFSPIEPFHFAITCSVRVNVYNPITNSVVKNLSRFRENAYGATFKSDGKLICAGGEEGVVKLFDVASKSLLRLFKGHGAAVHRSFFIPDKPQIISCSDDKMVKLWDIPTEKELLSFSEHVDYIRSGAVNPSLPNVFISGGYDNKINAYDLRTEKVIFSLDHGAPVESLLFLPTGGLFLSAGGNDVKVWDFFAGGKCSRILSEHHKTVTCLHMASNNKRILSGSLDQHVKIYDLNFEVVHTLDFPNSILSLGVSKNDNTLVAGFVDGIVSIHRRKEDKIEDVKQKKISKYERVSAEIDTFVPEIHMEKEAKYDKYLRKFQFSKALDSVFVKYVTGKTPEKTVAVLDELMKRKALGKALQGRDQDFIKRFLQFSIRAIPDVRFMSVVIKAFDIFFDELEDTIMTELTVENSRLLTHFKELLVKIVQMESENIRIGAMIDLIGSAAEQPCEVVENDNLQLLPSAEAQKNLIVDIN